MTTSTVPRFGSADQAWKLRDLANRYERRVLNSESEADGRRWSNRYDHHVKLREVARNSARGRK